MSKEFDAAKAQDNMNILTIEEEAHLLLAGFKKVDTDNLEGLNVEYMKFEEDTQYDLIFTGMTTMKNKSGNDIPAVFLINEKGEKKINGNTILAERLKTVTQLPCYVRIITKKEVDSKNNNGSYLLMDIYVIPQSKKS